MLLWRDAKHVLSSILTALGRQRCRSLLTVFWHDLVYSCRHYSNISSNNYTNFIIVRSSVSIGDILHPPLASSAGSGNVKYPSIPGFFVPL
jgi:hypothetical protein